MAKLTMRIGRGAGKNDELWLSIKQSNAKSSKFISQWSIAKFSYQLQLIKTSYYQGHNTTSVTFWGYLLTTHYKSAVVT